MAPGFIDFLYLILQVAFRQVNPFSGFIFYGREVHSDNFQLNLGKPDTIPRLVKPALPKFF